ncbi:alpha/beta hydrolase family esterase [Sedimentitalea sp. HM32M-2]|uniref:alpha/beta hydrolase family esterase n=1 Tax=Sedimentitalea sp. HM32M-2 TaxID=3351566 RepID=UPI0036311AA3
MSPCKRAFLAAFLTVALSPDPAAACGPDSDCLIGTRSYRIRMPDGVAKEPVPALIFAHGYKGTAATVIGNARLTRLAGDLGVALIAPQAVGQDWSIANAPSPDRMADIDEPAYFDAVIADATQRLPIDPDRIVAAGFSSGGMMVWTLACERGDRYAGFIALSGTFWDPVPDTCPSPAASLIHIHGTADRVVPPGGRPIKDARQGDVAAALSTYARHGRYGPPHSHEMAGLTCRIRRNDAGTTLGSCQFEGGHSFDTAHIAAAWQLLMASGR